MLSDEPEIREGGKWQNWNLNEKSSILKTHILYCHLVLFPLIRGGPDLTVTKLLLEVRRISVCK